MLYLKNIGILDVCMATWEQDKNDKEENRFMQTVLKKVDIQISVWTGQEQKLWVLVKLW